MRPAAPVRRLLAATTLLALPLLLEPAASAQGYRLAQPPPGPPAPAVEGQVGAASVETSYLLALYMTALANAGHPPSPSDIDEATRQYLTNGAALTSVPSSGPSAAYFQNGASVTGAPSSGPGSAYFHSGAELFAYPTARASATAAATAPTPSAVPTVLTGPAAPPVLAGEDAGAGTPFFPGTDDGGAEAATEDAAPGPAQLDAAQPATTAASAAAPGATPAASAVASSSSTGAPYTAGPGWTQGATGTASTLRPAPAETCPPASPSPLGRLVLALGGALCGGLAVALWTRPRALRGKNGATAK